MNFVKNVYSKIKAHRHKNFNIYRKCHGNREVQTKTSLRYEVIYKWTPSVVPAELDMTGSPADSWGCCMMSEDSVLGLF